MGFLIDKILIFTKIEEGVYKLEVKAKKSNLKKIIKNSKISDSAQGRSKRKYGILEFV